MAKKRATKSVKTPTPLSGVPTIPSIVVGREWPFFIEHRDAESIDAVIDAVDVLWGRTGGDVTIDNRAFFGPTAKFTGVSGAPDQGDARIAIANYRHLVKSWRELLAKPCWSNEKTYPPANVLAALIDQSIVSADINALSVLRHHDHKSAINWLEQSRLEAVVIIRPTMAVFFASLTVEGKWTPPKERDDTPTEADILIGRIVLAEMTARNPSVDSFREAVRVKGHKASNTKLGKLFKLIKAERRK